MVSTRSVLAVGLLVLLAGCGGVFGGGDGGSDGGDGPTTAAPTPTTQPAPGGSTLPPGVSESEGLTDVSALVGAHDAALEGATYEATLHLEQHQATPNATVNRTTDQTVRVGDGSYRTDLTTDRTGSPGFNTSVWSNGSVAVRQAYIGDQPQYSRVSPEEFVAQLSGERTLSGYLTLGDYTVERVTASDGTTFVTLTADEYNGTPQGGDVTEFDSTLRVDSQGRIHELAVDLTTEVNGTTTTVSFDYELERVGGVTVERPAWVPTALDETS